MEYIKTKEYTVRDLKEEELCEIKEYMKEDMIKSYPNFIKWFDRIKESKDRKFIGVVDNKNTIIGIMILKLSERKICTLYIKEPYRNSGYGNILILLSFDIMNTKYPKITVSEYNIRDFAHLLNKHNFLVKESKKGKYKKEVYEYVFN